MTNYSESKQENLVTNEMQPKRYFQQSWWRVFLIPLALISFIIAGIFNGLASNAPNAIFTQGIANASNKNPTEYTPARWTYHIFGIIYSWQIAWLVYAISRIPRKSNTNYLYIFPNTLPFIVFIIYIIHMIFLQIGWLVLWDREYFGWSFVFILFMFITIVIPATITHIHLQRNRSIYIDSNQALDIWLVRIFVHNGLAIYGTWLYIATTLNLTVLISKIYDQNRQTITNASTVGLTLILIGVSIYFICENFIFYSSMAYTFIPWFVLIYVLLGVLSKNYNNNNISNRNKSYQLTLFIITCILFIIRLGLFIIRYMKQRIPTLRNP